MDMGCDKINIFLLEGGSSNSPSSYGEQPQTTDSGTVAAPAEIYLNWEDDSIRDEIDRYLTEVAVKCFGHAAQRASFGQQIISVLTVMRGSFKKDARVWLHKSHSDCLPTTAEYAQLRHLARHDLRRLKHLSSQSVSDQVESTNTIFMGTLLPKGANSVPNIPLNSYEDEGGYEARGCITENIRDHASQQTLEQEQVDSIVATKIHRIRKTQQQEERDESASLFPCSKKACIVAGPQTTSTRQVFRTYRSYSQHDHKHPLEPQAYLTPEEIYQPDPEMLMYYQRLSQHSPDRA